MKEIQVSVIIPVYNEERYLPRCLDSMQAQTLEGIEVICVDDGSTDHSLEILQAYANKDSRFRVFTQPNRYAGAARNLGMKYAAGKYISFLDADDFFSPLFLKKMYDAAEEQAADISMCNICHYDSITGKTAKRNIPGEKEFLPKNRQTFNRDDIPEHLFQITNGWAWDKLFRTAFIQECGLFFSDTRVANDGYFVFMALAMAKRITKIEDYLVTQRVNNENSLSNTRNTSWYCGIQMLYDIRSGLKNAGLYDKLESTFLNFSLKYLIWAYESLKDWQAKKEFYNCIREECREKLGILQTKLDMSYCRKQFETYTHIETHSFDDYVIEILEKRTKEWEEERKKNQKLTQRVEQKIWPFPYAEVDKNSSILLYGAGKIGQDYYKQILASGYCRIAKWIDRRFQTGKKEYAFQGWLDDLSRQKFDVVVVALFREEDAVEAMALLREAGIAENKMIWKIGTGGSLCR